jgi:hypothetical protein
VCTIHPTSLLHGWVNPLTDKFCKLIIKGIHFLTPVFERASAYSLHVRLGKGGFQAPGCLVRDCGLVMLIVGKSDREVTQDGKWNGAGKGGVVEAV